MSVKLNLRKAMIGIAADMSIKDFPLSRVKGGLWVEMLAPIVDLFNKKRLKY